MHSPNFFILYVDNPLKSAAFYQDSAGTRAAWSRRPSFALFVLDAGVKLGLWARQHRRAGGAAPQAVEMRSASPVEDKAQVEAVYAQWSKRGLDRGAGSGGNGLRLHLRRRWIPTSIACGSLPPAPASRKAGC